jgi:hypothetical protein
LQKDRVAVWLALATTLLALGGGALIVFATDPTGGVIPWWWLALAWGSVGVGILIFLFLLVPALGRPFTAAATRYRTRKVERLTSNARYRQILRCPIGHEFEAIVRPTSHGYLPDDGTEWEIPNVGPWFVCPACGAVDGCSSQSLEPFNEAARKRDKLLRRWPFS